MQRNPSLNKEKHDSNRNNIDRKNIPPKKDREKYKRSAEKEEKKKN